MALAQTLWKTTAGRQLFVATSSKLNNEYNEQTRSFFPVHEVDGNYIYLSEKWKYVARLCEGRRVSGKYLCCQTSIL